MGWSLELWLGIQLGSLLAACRTPLLGVYLLRPCVVRSFLQSLLPWIQSRLASRLLPSYLPSWSRMGWGDSWTASKTQRSPCGYCLFTSWLAGRQYRRSWFCLYISPEYNCNTCRQRLYHSQLIGACCYKSFGFDPIIGCGTFIVKSKW